MGISLLVVDTSVVIKWLSNDNEKDLDKADKILDDVMSGKVSLLAPELMKHEAGNVLLHGKKLSSAQAKICLTTLYSLPITYISETEVIASSCFVLAKKLGITYYDATFIAVANEYDACLVTDNMKHQGKAQSNKVIALKDY